jgi:DNA-binding response OmpR family regulator
MKHALIVSDDVHTRAWVAQALSGLDLHTTECTLGEMQKNLLGSAVDLVVVDGGRSAEAAVQVVEHAASGGIDLCLIVLIESEGLPSLRLPIRLSSDFIVRGGSSEELVARTRAVLWPGEEVTQQELVRVDNLTLNLATYQAYVEGVPVDFTYLEYALFSFLVTHPGRTYSREVLLRRVWGSDYYGGSRTVDVHVRRVRSKIGHELSRRLETVRNVGYLWST